MADEIETITQLPVLQTEIVQKNQSGPQYQVGDRIQLTVRIPIEVSQQLQAIQLKSANDKEPLDKGGWFLDPTPQIINGNLRFIASPIKTGKLLLPELIILKDETHAVAKTTSISVDVADLKANPESTPSLIDAISISIPTKFIILGILILGLLFYAVFYLNKRFFKKKSEIKRIDEIKIPPTPDHVIALRDLNLLYEKHPYSKENLKPVAFGVSEILKTFFSARFKIDAKESTSDEMIVLLKKESLPENDLKKIKGLFENLDIIKFTETNHHQNFQKGDYLEFKDHARTLIESWTVRGDQL